MKIRLEKKSKAMDINNAVTVNKEGGVDSGWK